MEPRKSVLQPGVWMGVLGIDVGGSGIKGAIVDTETGDLLSDRVRLPTPQPSAPESVAEVVKELVDQLGYDGTMAGCSFPTVVANGQARTAGNIDERWPGTQVDELFGTATGLQFVVHNDADVAGLAELNLGAGKGLTGTVIMVTIGTGLGTGVYHDGKLVPNIELGRMPGKDGEPIEFYAGDRARKEAGLTWLEFGDRFNYFLQRAARVSTPAHFIIGGGSSKHFDEFADRLDVGAGLHVAHFMNNAGIVGAAMAASAAPAQST